MKKLIIILSILFLTSFTQAQEIDVNEERPAISTWTLYQIVYKPTEKFALVIHKKGYKLDHDDDPLTPMIFVETGGTIETEFRNIEDDPSTEDIDEAINEALQFKNFTLIDFNKVNQAVKIKHGIL